MKVYLAGPWAHRGDMEDIAQQIEALGHQITWKWWTTPDIPEKLGHDKELREQAINDLNGVRSADLLVVVNSAKSEGKAVEQGLALGLGKPIIIVGNPAEHSANVFHYLPQFRWAPHVQAMLEILNTINWLIEGGHASRSE